MKNAGTKPTVSRRWILSPKCSKTHLRAIWDFKNFSGGYTPGPPFEGEPPLTRREGERITRGEGRGGEEGEREGDGRGGAGRKGGGEGTEGGREGGRTRGVFKWVPLVICLQNNHCIQRMAPRTKTIKYIYVNCFQQEIFASLMYFVFLFFTVYLNEIIYFTRLILNIIIGLPYLQHRNASLNNQTERLLKCWRHLIRKSKFCMLTLSTPPYNWAR